MSRIVLIALTIFLGTSSALVVPPRNGSSISSSTAASVPSGSVSVLATNTTSGNSSLAAPGPSTSQDAELDKLLSEYNSTNSTGAPQVIEDGQEYVVLFDSNHPTPPVLSDILDKVGLDKDLDIKYVFNNSAFKGFAGNLKEGHVTALNAMKEVSLVEASVEVTSFSPYDRSNVPWGLQRISQEGEVTGQADELSFNYKFDSAGALGQGVDIYILDTGINTAHTAFGGRARMGFSMNGDGDLGPECDQEGHGTHVSGTAAGYPYGVATSANLIGVKVLGATGSGTSSDTISGLDYVISTHDSRKGASDFIGSIASMSWGLNARMTSFEQAFDAVISQGVHVSVAAGNAGGDACSADPGSLGGTGGGAIAVGSMNINDQISSFSNTGQCVDVYAPGESVISSWIGSATATNMLSGTSMACPHVTGLMAYLMAQNPSLAQSPAALKKYIASSALPGLLGSPSASLINNGFTGASA